MTKKDPRLIRAGDKIGKSYTKNIQMATLERVKKQMEKNGLTSVNKPKRTPKHPTKSHVVMAKEGDSYKLVRFGQQGVKGIKNPKTKAEKIKQENFPKRHAKNIAKGKMSAAYWSFKTKW